MGRHMRLIRVVLLLFACCGAPACPRHEGEPGEAKGTITISGAWALYPMATRWAEVYQQAHPGIRVDVSAGGAGKGAADALSGLVDIGMVSRTIQPAEIEKGGFPIGVVRDAVLPVMNDRSPVRAELLARGLSRDAFVRIWMEGKALTWGELAGAAASESVHVFTRSDSCGAAETWAQYLGGKQEDLKGIGVYGDPGIAEKVASDTLGIGYNNLNFAYEPKTRQPVPGLCPIPMDLNGNGRVDPEEAFYATKDSLLKAIMEGRYPSPPARKLYFLTRGKPALRVRDFVTWVLTDGQAYAEEVGYVPLAEAERQEALKSLE